MPLQLLTKPPAAHAGIPIVCPVKNEIRLLPHFLAHHRAIGLREFVFIDNASTDGTLEYLLQQDGCTVFHTKDSYAASWFARDWINEVISAHFPEQWVLYLDCDELLVYEDMENRPLDQFISQYSGNGTDTFFGILLDLYPEGDWRGIKASDLRSIYSTLNCFDSDYVIRRRPTKPWVRRAAPTEVIGGPRCRLLSSLEKDAAKGWLAYMLAGQVDRFVRHVPIEMMPYLARIWPRGTEAQFKTPLNFTKPGFGYTYSHGTTNTNFGGSMLAVLHLKFCDELNARFDPVFSWENHYRRGLERFQLAGALERYSGSSFCYPGTRRFSTSADLVKEGLLGERPAIWANGAQSFRTGTSQA
jgi:glycosyltransferase involved in cell wall biosynthesis